jgi:tripartite-type tricarboxylate transporter receptor subunit TctC
MGEMVMTLARREFFGVAAGAAALAGGARSAAAALYPDRPIRLVLPFPPGGVFDIVGRPWADKVKASLGPVFVDNQPGACGSLAAQLVAHAPPDGYTIFLGGSTIHLTEMILREHPLLDPMKELTPVSWWRSPASPSSSIPMCRCTRWANWSHTSRPIPVRWPSAPPAPAP